MIILSILMEIIGAVWGMIKSIRKKKDDKKLFHKIIRNQMRTNDNASISKNKIKYLNQKAKSKNTMPNTLQIFNNPKSKSKKY